jgi:hypothetical protein
VNIALGSAQLSVCSACDADGDGQVEINERLALDGRAWIALPTGRTKPRRPFLFPVPALAAVFRGKYLAGLQRARGAGQLHFAGQSDALAAPPPWQAFLDSLAQTAWVVYCKPPFGSPTQVLKYLSRYTHRVAIANDRLLFVGDGVVRFAYRDYADHHQLKEMTLPGTEFLRRFLLHLVPRGFMRIRHYGLLANCQRQAKLARFRELLGAAPALPAALASAPATHERARAAEPEPPPCPRCGAPLHVIEILPAAPRHLMNRSARSLTSACTHNASCTRNAAVSPPRPPPPSLAPRAARRARAHRPPPPFSPSPIALHRLLPAPSVTRRAC